MRRYPRLLLTILALAPFLPALWQPFFADDYIHIDRFRYGSDAGTLLHAWVLSAADAAAWWADPHLAVGYFRPLVSLAFLGDWLLWKMAPFGYHFTNVILHVGTTLVTFATARRLLRSETKAWIAGAVFALHPAHVEAVAWISARTDLLVGLLVSLAFFIYLTSWSTVGKRWRLVFVSLAAFALALLSKEMAIVFPALLLVHDLVYRSESVWRRLEGGALAFVVALPYLALRAGVLGGFASPPHPFFHAPGDADALSNAAHAAVVYLADLVLFVPCDPVVTLPFWRSHPWAFVGLGIATFGLLAGSLAAIERSERRFSALWMVLSLVPVLAVSPGERFLYLPSIGYCMLVGARGLSTRRVLVFGLVLLGAVTTFKTIAFGSVAYASRGLVEDLLHAIDESPDTRFVLVADLPAVGALGLEQAVRLERPRRALEVEILSIAPGFLLSNRRATTVRPLEDDLTLSLPDAGWRSYITQAFWSERDALEKGDRVARDWMEVEILSVAAGRPERIAVHLSAKARGHTLFLRVQDR